MHHFSVSHHLWGLRILRSVCASDSLAETARCILHLRGGVNTVVPTPARGCCSPVSEGGVGESRTTRQPGIHTCKTTRSKTHSHPARGNTHNSQMMSITFISDFLTVLNRRQTERRLNSDVKSARMPRYQDMMSRCCIKM